MFISSAKYYQNNKERLQKISQKISKSFLRRKRRKKHSMVEKQNFCWVIIKIFHPDEKEIILF